METEEEPLAVEPLPLLESAVSSSSSSVCSWVESSDRERAEEDWKVVAVGAELAFAPPKVLDGDEGEDLGFLPPTLVPPRRPQWEKLLGDVDARAWTNTAAQVTKPRKYIMDECLKARMRLVPLFVRWEESGRGRELLRCNDRMRFLVDFAVGAVLISYFCRHSGQIAVVVEANMVWTIHLRSLWDVILVCRCRCEYHLGL
mmetsp:Transcript_32097/g.63894  ORF Transcript_32097/g.63894 Transcript_32097/m.63894 type:complete len:201 (-) Transcript_32097:25-627(-)